MRPGKKQKEIEKALSINEETFNRKAGKHFWLLCATKGKMLLQDWRRMYLLSKYVISEISPNFIL